MSFIYFCSSYLQGEGGLIATPPPLTSLFNVVYEFGLKEDGHFDDSIVAVVSGDRLPTQTSHADYDAVIVGGTGNVCPLFLLAPRGRWLKYICTVLFRI